MYIPFCFHLYYWCPCHSNFVTVSFYSKVIYQSQTVRGKATQNKNELAFRVSFLESVSHGLLPFQDWANNAAGVYMRCRIYVPCQIFITHFNMRLFDIILASWNDCPSCNNQTHTPNLNVVLNNFWMLLTR